MTSSTEVTTGPVSALENVYAAWADNDAAAFAACFTADASSILPGAFRSGAAEVQAQMAAAFAGPYAGSTVRDQVQGVRMLGADVAVVVSRSGVVLAGDSEPPADRWVLATWTLERHGDAWLVAAYHNCPAPTV